MVTSSGSIARRELRRFRTGQLDLEHNTYEMDYRDGLNTLEHILEDETVFDLLDEEVVDMEEVLSEIEKIMHRLNQILNFAGSRRIEQERRVMTRIVAFLKDIQTKFVDVVIHKNATDTLQRGEAIGSDMVAMIDTLENHVARMEIEENDGVDSLGGLEAEELDFDDLS